MHFRSILILAVVSVAAVSAKLRGDDAGRKLKESASDESCPFGEQRYVGYFAIGVTLPNMLDTKACYNKEQSLRSIMKKAIKSAGILTEVMHSTESPKIDATVCYPTRQKKLDDDRRALWVWHGLGGGHCQLCGGGDDDGGRALSLATAARPVEASPANDSYLSILDEYRVVLEEFIVVSLNRDVGDVCFPGGQAEVEVNIDPSSEQVTSMIIAQSCS